MFENKKLQESDTESGNFGLYIHIPFCKQACHYCDFHFSTSLNKKGDLVNAICEELFLRKNEMEGKVETIYFGGGTPSLLTSEELKQIFDSIDANYTLIENPEITLEANPDDLTLQKIELLAKSPINRLSIGIQSFFGADLKLMNRAHNANEALECVKHANKYFGNISIDLIYGIPGMSLERWVENLEIVLELDIPHLSCYALTVEPRTALKSLIEKGKVPPVDEEVAKEHYEILLEITEKAGFKNYEFSNFGKLGFQSRNNTAYWEGKSYLGIGPSAHSYDGKCRSWNIANNTKYIKAIQAGILPSEKEILSKKDKYNEYIMTALRTEKGVSLDKIERDFGAEFLEYVTAQAYKSQKKNLMVMEGQHLKITKNAKFLGDGIASDLFMI